MKAKAEHLTMETETSELSQLVDHCSHLLHQCSLRRNTDSNESLQRSITSLSVSRLRLLSWRQRCISASSFSTTDALDTETAGRLLRNILLDLQNTRDTSLREYNAADEGEDSVSGNTIPAAALTAQLRLLALATGGDTQGEYSEGSDVWQLSSPKDASRLAEDISEKLDDLTQLLPTQRDPNSGTSDIDALSAFWLGVAAANSGDAAFRNALARYAAQTIEGFHVEQHLDKAGDGPARYQQGHSYSNIQTSGNATAVMGDQYGGKSILDD